MLNKGRSCTGVAARETQIRMPPPQGPEMAGPPGRTGAPTLGPCENQGLWLSYGAPQREIDTWLQS